MEPVMRQWLVLKCVVRKTGHGGLAFGTFESPGGISFEIREIQGPRARSRMSPVRRGSTKSRTATE